MFVVQELETVYGRETSDQHLSTFGQRGNAEDQAGFRLYPHSESGTLVRCQNAICQQAQATEIGETRSLGDSRHHGQV